MNTNQQLSYSERKEYQSPQLKVFKVVILKPITGSLPANITGPGFSASRSCQTWDDNEYNDE